MLKGFRHYFSPARYCPCRVSGLDFPAVFTYCHVASRFPAFPSFRHKEELRTPSLVHVCFGPGQPTEIFHTIPNIASLNLTLLGLFTCKVNKGGAFYDPRHPMLSLHSFPPQEWLQQSQQLINWMLWGHWVLFSELCLCKLHRSVELSRN